MVYAIIAVLIAAIIYIVKLKSDINAASEKEDDALPDEIYPYRKKYLLTKNELYFYKALRIFADQYGYAVITKIRLADLIEVSNEAPPKKKRSYFYKIQSKHIDFALCNKENLYPILLIELNDRSHQNENRMKRDSFIKNALEKAGYKLLFVYGTQDLEEKITDCLGETVKK